MIRPSSLLRRDSAQTHEFVAPANNIPEESLDCGIAVLPCCLPKWFQRFATPRVFIIALAILAIFQGALQTYFKASILNVQEIFDYSSPLVDWLSVSHEIFLALTAIIVAYWGNRIHRTAWIGGLACFEGAACFLVMIPYLEQINSPNVTVIVDSPAIPNLCQLTHMSESGGLEFITISTTDHKWITLSVLFLLQFVVGMANSSFFAHGFSYIDDNVDSRISPVFLGVAIGVRIFANQIGSFLAWSLLSKDSSWWIGYPILGACLIVAGTLVATFPRNLLNTLLRQTAASILDIATGNQSMQSIRVINTVDKSQLSFFNTIKRIFTNKILIVQTLSISIVFMAIRNFISLEPKYMEAQFYLPTIGEGFRDPWTSRLLRNILESPIVTLAVLLSALVIIKAKPRTQRILGYNLVTFVKVAIIFLSFVFIECNHSSMAGEYKGHLLTPLCSRACECDSNNVKFQPVCLQNDSTTYFSPCHAGCSEVAYVNNVMIFQNCVCGTVPSIATEGACNNERCQLRWQLYQIFSMMTSAFIASTFVGNLLIVIRSVLPSDKSVALAFVIGTTTFITQVPGKLMYWGISRETCLYRNSNGYDCNLQSAKFGDIISGVTCGFFLLAALLQGVVLYWSKNLDLYPSLDDNPGAKGRSPLQISPDSSLEMPRRPSRPIRPAPARPSTNPAQPPEEQPLNRDQMQADVIDEFVSQRSTLV